MKHKLCAICPVCRDAVAIVGRRIVRHTRRSHFGYRETCDGTNAAATDDAVRAWLMIESARADDDAARVPVLRADADQSYANAIARINEREREAAALRAFVAAQLAKLGGAS